MKPYYEHAGITIYHGDCREILPSLPSVQLVFTDPPYAMEFDHVWDYLNLCQLLDGGSLLTYCGHYQLPRVINAIQSFRFHWLCIQPNADGINPIMHGFAVKINFKPVIWFAKRFRERWERLLRVLQAAYKTKTTDADLRTMVADLEDPMPKWREA